MRVVQTDLWSGPANRVTLVRALLSLVVAGLVVASYLTPVSVPMLVALASVALALDWVDGQVARRTGTVTAFGARFDMEVDAFLILVLSGYAAHQVGAWVLLIGLARYLLLAAEWVWPWLRRPVPPRYWRKVVAAIQGVTLTVVATGWLSMPAAALLLLAALALLAESFGRDVVWLARTREQTVTPPPRRRAVVSGVLAIGLVWVILVAPNRLEEFAPAAFARLPLEALGFAALTLALPRRAAVPLAAGCGAVLSLVGALKLLDLGFNEALGRPFDPLIDWRYARDVVHLVRDSFGPSLGTVLLVVAGSLLVGVAVGIPLALQRISRLIRSHPRSGARAVGALTFTWLLMAVAGVQAAGTSVASVAASAYAAGQITRIPSVLRDQRDFERATRADPLKRTPADRLLRGLRGKDVLLVFVESYGRVALEDPGLAPSVRDVLRRGEETLAGQGFRARSAYLTSPTFGALSWLAHATLQSGLRVDSQQRYDVLVTSERETLSSAFGRAGWRTVATVPANTREWPQGEFYDFDRVYDSRDVGYEGPRFGYPTMPDQYTLDALQRLELSPSASPVFAEVDLISSHAPWSRTPRMVDQREVGDGSVFDGMPDTLPSEDEIWPSPTRVRAAYGESVEYSLAAVLSFIEHYGTDETVLVVLGDHQPATIVSGADAGHDVPVSVIAKDPAVLDRIDDWGWQDGLVPSPDAPLWPMASFRDRFLEAYAR